MSLGLANVKDGNIQVCLSGDSTPGVNRGCVIIYIFMKVLWYTKIQMFVNEGCSFENDSLFNREPV